MLCQVFRGNTDVISIVKRTLITLTRTKLLRFRPVDYKGYPTLRVEIYGTEGIYPFIYQSDLSLSLSLSRENSPEQEAIVNKLLEL